MFKQNFITRNIILLSLISLLTDVASEMLYPVMPLYFQKIGYGVILIGLLEGVGDLIAGLAKTIIGFYSDKLHNRKSFIIAGYGLSAFSKPLIGLTTSAPAIMTGRFLDRFGKGIRTSPRDALLVGDSLPENRGSVFGFHRSMDTLGAITGPLITLGILYYYQTSYSNIFLLALIPGIFAFGLTFLIREKRRQASQDQTKSDIKFGLKDFLKTMDPNYRKLLIGFLILLFLNSSDMFLLLRASQQGSGDISIISSYIIYNVIFALSAYPLGILSDKIGFQKIFMMGVVVFAFVYGLFGMGVSGYAVFLVFAMYGIFASVKESTMKAWISLYIPENYQATGMGVFMTLGSIAFLLGNLTTGTLWEMIGPEAALATSSVASIIVLYYFSTIKLDPISAGSQAGLDKLGCNSGH